MTHRRPTSVVAQLVIVGLTLLVASLVFVFRGKPDAPVWVPGASVNVKLTLLTSDSFDTDCVHPEHLGAGACTFYADKKKRGRSKTPVLRPYMSVDRRLLLLPDLFKQPDLAQRLKKEPPRRGRNRLKRFKTKCRIELVQQSKVKIRFMAKHKWSEPMQGWVGKIDSCSIIP